MKKKVGFLNIDLDIETKPEYSLEPIVKDLEDSIFILRHEKYQEINYLSIELSDFCGTDNPEAILLGFFEKLKGLSPEGKEAWTLAYKKEFNLGYVSGVNSDALYNELSTSILQSTLELGASIGITIYPFLSKKENRKRIKKAEKANKKIKNKKAK